jgi:uncharacterized membrane protein HdeD (DUF308 family)
MDSVTTAQPVRNYRSMLIVRAILAVLFGIAVLVWPRISLLIFIYLFGAFAFVDGIVAIVAAFTWRKDISYWWVLLVGGILGVVFGLVTFIWPGLTALTLLYVFAAWLIVTGIAQIVFAFTLRWTPSRELMLVIAGALALLLGIFLFVRPGAGILSLVWLVGIYAIVYGAILFIRAFMPVGANDIS